MRLLIVRRWLVTPCGRLQALSKQTKMPLSDPCPRVHLPLLRYLIHLPHTYPTLAPSEASQQAPSLPQY